MEQNPYDLAGMEPLEAKKYILDHLASLRLTETRLAELESGVAKWTGRAELARSKGAEDLAAEAEKEAARLRDERNRIAAEAAELRAGIDRMRAQIPGLEARVRTVDPDLLEQELLMAAGRLPGDDAAAAAERRLADLERNAGAEDALAALKAKLEKENGA